jgi:hypothetical protein
MTSSYTSRHGYITFATFARVLDVLRHHHLFVKQSKCAFAAPSVAYLGHMISTAGVAMDPAKVQAILD